MKPKSKYEVKDFYITIRPSTSSNRGSLCQTIPILDFDPNCLEQQMQV
jgi:hypothetical protein